MVANGRLHQLDQNAARVPRVDEHDRRPVRADARLAEHGRALRAQIGDGSVDVGHLKADVVLTPSGFFLRKLAIGELLS